MVEWFLYGPIAPPTNQYFWHTERCDILMHSGYM